MKSRLVTNFLVSAILYSVVGGQQTFLEAENAFRMGAKPEIIGGQAVNPGQYPFFIEPLGNYVCGATLIWDDIGLTAAHCVKAFSGVTVLVGNYMRGSTQGGAVARQVDKVVQHPGYTESTLYDDYMVFKLSKPVNNAATMPLNPSMSDPAAGDPLTVIGFGTLVRTLTA